MIVIDTDDMNFTDMFVMQKTLALLGAGGTTFQNSYVSYPLCCPSRATFLTGQYAHNHGVVTDNQYGVLDNTNTLAVWLNHAKYRTAMVGKYLNGYGLVNRREIPPGWTQWFALTGGTEQKRYAFNMNENGKLVYYPRKPQNYIDYVLNAKVNGLLKEWAPSPKPFFLYYNPNNPHGERALPPTSTRDPEPAPQYLGRFGDIGAPHTSELQRRRRLRQAGRSQESAAPFGRTACGPRPPLPGPAREPALRRRRGEADRRPRQEVRGQAEDLLHLHLRQRAGDGLTPDHVQELPI